MRALFRGLVVAGLVLCTRPALAAEPSAPADALTLDEVLASVDATHPDLEYARLGLQAAEGQRQSARGHWDPKLAAKGKWIPVGYYQTGQFDAYVRQETPLWGLGAYAGYRLGLGNFAVYKGELETRNAGEVRAGLDLPLWRGGSIDAGRAEIARSKLAVDAAQCGIDSKRLSVRQKAANSYWKWVEAGQEVRIQGELLEVARARDAGLREQAALGSQPAILVTDNERLMLEREAKLVAARRDFAETSLSLSLFLRDGQAKPVVAGLERVPSFAASVGQPSLPAEEADIQSAVGQRPELCELELARRRAEVEVRLAKNERAPDIRVQAFVSRDLGDGPVELQPTELGVGAGLEVPLGLRKARGKLAEARAKRAQVDAQLRGATDRVAAEVRTARVDLLAAHQQLELARRQVAVAQALADAERERLREGASDLIVVNLRELAAADAARLEVEATARYYRAVADYLAATGRVGSAELNPG